MSFEEMPVVARRLGKIKKLDLELSCGLVIGELRMVHPLSNYCMKQVGTLTGDREVSTATLKG